MKIAVSSSPPSTAAQPSHRNIVSQPQSASATSCLFLLAFAAGSLDSPIGSLTLHADDQSPFRAHLTSLRLPDRDRVDCANELLWYASRHDSTLRCGGALLAQPVTAADRCELEALGFSEVQPASDSAAKAEEAEEAPEQGAPLALVHRRDPDEPSADSSHAALLVSDIRRSIDFWSLLHFKPTRLFSTQGARAAWLSAPWTSLSLELIEVPSVVLRSQSCDDNAASGAVDADVSASIGLAHVCVDVTPLGIGMPSTLEVLRERSRRQFGRDLTILNEPHQQMMADLVAEVAVVRAPDGVQLELVHRAGLLQVDMTPDWSLEES